MLQTERFSGKWSIFQQRQSRNFGREVNSHVFNLDKSCCWLWDYRNGTHAGQNTKRIFITNLSLRSSFMFLCILFPVVSLSLVGALVTGLHRSKSSPHSRLALHFLHWLMLTQAILQYLKHCIHLFLKGTWNMHMLLGHPRKRDWDL